MHPLITKENELGAQTYSPLNIVLTKAKGVYVWDDAGNKYIDFMSAYSAVSMGHAHPRLLEVFKQQASTLTIVSRAFYTDRLSPFFEKITKFTGMDMILPMNTGAEGVETAVKAARRWGYEVKGIPEGQAEIIVCDGNFHGRTTTVISFSSEKDYQRGFGPLTPGFKIIPFGDAEALEKAITPNTCAFLTEPMQGEGGIIIPAKGWLKKVREICTNNNVLLMVDEIQTGLGRTGKNFAFQHELENDLPDGLILGKALGGGLFPVSAFLAKKEVMDVFDPGSHGSTWGGNPLAATIALESLKVIEEEKLSERSAELGAYLKEQLEAIDSPKIKEIRGSGLWVAMELHPELADAHKVCEELLTKGILAKETHEVSVRFAPPLVITKEQIDFAVNKVKEVLI